jgi:DNA invertase Pin-like site-specific DNA recombinase
VRQLPFWLLNSRVVTEYLQSGHLNVLKPFIIVMVYLRQLSECGVKFKSFTEQYVDSLGIFGDAIIGLLAAMAQQERCRISDRTKAGIARLKAAGVNWKRGPNRKYRNGQPSPTTLWRRRKGSGQSAAPLA